MNLESNGKESTQCRESRDMRVAEKHEKVKSAEKETSYGKPKRYLIGFGMLTKTNKSLYVVHYE